MTDWPALADKYLMAFVKRQPLTLVRGQGSRVWDDKGREYLDFLGGWAVNSLGHCHPVVVKAITEQAGALIQPSNSFFSIPQIQLAQLLVENSCFQKAFFSNSGAEAVEGAVKLARKYGKLHLNGAYEVITALNSFHGRTLAMTAATGQHKFHEPFEPMPAGFVNVEYDSIEAIKKATNPRTCAVMLEPLQGEGGVNIPSAPYLKEVRAWCDEKGILLIFDEVQTGIGRLGRLFGYQEFGVEPDIIALAKGLGSGFPMGAFLAKDKAAVFVPGEHGSTFGGNPLACAVGYAVVKYVIDNDVPGNARKMGELLTAGLRKLRPKFDFITDVRGCGLLIALQFDRDLAERVVKGCRERGLLLNPLKPNTIRFMPALIVTEAEINEALEVLHDALREVRVEEFDRENAPKQ